MNRYRNQLRIVAGACVAGVALLAAFVLICNAVVLHAAAPYEFEDLTHVAARPVAIVFGAGLNPDGTPTPMLADRIDGGIELLRAGRVGKLLFTGDNGTVEHNELASMLNYALGRDVPRAAIVLDYAGFDTYDSCYRAAAIFGVRSAVLVTQTFHMARAIYLCRHRGIDAIGYPRADWGRYAGHTMFSQTLREMISRTKAVIEATITRRPPKFLGPREPI
ncbi:MAG TPA: ElyC/SanA/YdcF family protein [Candidatus Acidoferrales bacterium]|jgi:vancomycin permeability regulator SanA|nr:ElyC/SanA/YdcF family protein [Candidatus Acidoferrales bacterium]